MTKPTRSYGVRDESMENSAIKLATVEYYYNKVQ